MGLRGHSNGPEPQIDVAPKQEGDFLISQSRQQTRGEQLSLSLGGDGEELGQLFLGVFQGKWHCSLREVKQAGEATSSVPLAELRDDHDIVKDRVRRHSGFHQCDDVVVELFGRDRIQSSSIECSCESR